MYWHPLTGVRPPGLSPEPGATATRQPVHLGFCPAGVGSGCHTNSHGGRRTPENKTGRGLSGQSVATPASRTI